MKAVILAAGPSKRLLPLTADKPKCLLKLSNDSILKRMLKQLLRANVKDIFIVVGYKEEKIHKEISELDLDLNIKVITNKDYDKTNNIYSLWIARSQLDGESFILVDGDLICDDMLIEKFIDWKVKNGLVVDNIKTLGKEEMKVLVENSRIKHISKKLKPKNAYGEYIGLAKFSKEGSRKLFEELKCLIEEKQFNEYYEAGFERVAKKIIIRYLGIGSNKWTEIDTSEDYEGAKNMFV